MVAWKPLIGGKKTVVPTLRADEDLRVIAHGEVFAGADMVIATYAKYPDALRSAGVLPTDLDTLTGLGNALRTADQGQEAKKVTAKEKTAARKAAQARVESGIAKIISAAELALVDQPERVALYHAALPTTTRKKKAEPPTP
jgi:hypothetical protein